MVGIGVDGVGVLPEVIRGNGEYIYIYRKVFVGGEAGKIVVFFSSFWRVVGNVCMIGRKNTLYVYTCNLILFTSAISFVQHFLIDCSRRFVLLPGNCHFQ